MAAITEKHVSATTNDVPTLLAINYGLLYVISILIILTSMFLHIAEKASALPLLWLLLYGVVWFLARRSRKKTTTDLVLTHADWQIKTVKRCYLAVIILNLFVFFIGITFWELLLDKKITEWLNATMFFAQNLIFIWICFLTNKGSQRLSDKKSLT